MMVYLLGHVHLVRYASDEHEAEQFDIADLSIAIVCGEDRRWFQCGCPASPSQRCECFEGRFQCQFGDFDGKGRDWQWRDLSALRRLHATVRTGPPWFHIREYRIIFYSILLQVFDPVSPSVAGVLQGSAVEPSDWIYNDGSTAVDLSGYSLTDNSYVPRQWVFPC